MMESLLFNQVTKAYGELVIFNQQNFRLQSGITFLVGKNGAGKTTFIRLAVGLEQPDSGSICMLGESARKLSVTTKKRLGIQLQNDAFMRSVKVEEYIRLYKSLYENNMQGERNIDLEEFGRILAIDSLKGRYAYALSGGEKKRLSLYLSIVGDKKLIILDEPTAGIDVEVKDRILSAISYLKQYDCDVIVSSHDLEEFYYIADNILIVDRGVVFDGTKDYFEQEYPYRYKVASDLDVQDSDLFEWTSFRQRYLYSRDRSVLQKHFPGAHIERTSMKDLYQIVLASSSSFAGSEGELR